MSLPGGEWSRPFLMLLLAYRHVGGARGSRDDGGGGAAFEGSQWGGGYGGRHGNVAAKACTLFNFHFAHPALVVGQRRR